MERLGSNSEAEENQILGVWQRLLLFVFPLLGMLLILLYLLAEWVGLAATTSIVGETLASYRHIFLAIVLLLGCAHLFALVRWAVWPLIRAQKSKAQVNALLDTIPDAFTLMDRGGTYLDARAANDDDWPRPAAEMVGKNISDVLPSKLAQRAMDNIHRALETNQPQIFEYSRDFQGKTYYFEVHNRRYDENSVVAILRNITKRRETEEQVRYQAALVENLLDAVISTDTNFCILSWNPAAEKIYGWSADEVIGKLIDDVLPCHWADGEETASRRALLEEGFWHGEVVQSHRSGQLLNILASTSLFRNAEGEITGAVSVNHDVTELRQAESALQKSENRNAALLDVIPDSLARVNREGIYLDVKLSQDLSWPVAVEEIVGKHLSDVLPAENAERALEAVRHVIQSGQPQEMEYELSLLGHRYCIEARLVQSGPDEALIISRDVTERHNAEAQLRYQAKMLESMSDVVFSVDNDSQILSWNKAAEQLYGWREDEVLGKVFVDVTFPTIVDGTMEEFNRILGKEGTWSGEVTKNHRDGARIDTLSSCDTIYDANGKPVGTLVVSRDVSQQKRAERALRESEARNSAMLNAIPDSLVVASRDGVYRSIRLQADINPGFGPDDLMGRRIGELLAPEATAHALQLIHEVLEHDVVRDVEFLLPEQEEDIYIEARMVKSGEDEVLIMARNVTERRRAEEQLRFQAELLQSVSDAVVSTDMEMRIVSWNRAAETMYGWREEEVVGQLFREALNLKIISETREQAVSRLMRDGVWQGEQTHQRRDGSQLTILSSISTLRDHRGNPTGYLGVNRDITERKEAEIALQESEARFRAMVQSAAEAIVLFDMNKRRVIEANDNALKLFDLSREKLLATQPEALGSDIQPNGGERETEIASIRRQLQEQGRLTYEWLFRVNGEDLLTEIRAVTLPDRQRWLVRYSIVDITERRLREERMQQAQKLESLGLLAGGIAHDFNNLLTGILGQTSLAQHRLPAEHPARINIERAAAAGQRARSLIQQMLAYAGRGQADMQEENLNDIIRESIKLLKTSMPPTITLETDLNAELPSIHMDVSQMEQLVVNLVLNAVDAIEELTSQGEIAKLLPATRHKTNERILLRTAVRQVDEPEINLFLSEEPLPPGRYLSLRVQDDGIGMRPATMARIFDPFFSTKLSGTGLGLSVAMGIIKRHGGGLNVSSQLNQGTIFEILLPIGPPKQIDDAVGILHLADA